MDEKTMPTREEMILARNLLAKALDHPEDPLGRVNPELKNFAIGQFGTLNWMLGRDENNLFLSSMDLVSRALERSLPERLTLRSWLEVSRAHDLISQALVVGEAIFAKLPDTSRAAAEGARGCLCWILQHDDGEFTENLRDMLAIVAGRATVEEEQPKNGER